MGNPFKPGDFARDRRTRKIGRVERVRDSMVEVKFNRRSSSQIINYGFLEKVKSFGG